MRPEVRSWLEPLRQRRDEAAGPASFFFRKDAVGGEHARRFDLLDFFSRYEVSIDIAVSPKSISPQSAGRFRTLLAERSKSLSVHQHGYAHVNHEQIGSKCEFGDSRSLELQHADIAAGKELLSDLLGPITDSIFT